MIRLTCPKCEKKLGIVDRFACKLDTCPSCKTRILVHSEEPEKEESSEELPEANELKEIYALEPAVELPPKEETPKPAKEKDEVKPHKEKDEGKPHKEKDDRKPAKEKENGKPAREKDAVKPAPADAGGEEGKEEAGEAKEGDEPSPETEVRVTGALKSPMEALLSLNWLWLLLLAIGSSSLLLSMLANLVPRVAIGVAVVGILVLFWG